MGSYVGLFCTKMWLLVPKKMEIWGRVLMVMYIRQIHTVNTQIINTITTLTTERTHLIMMSLYSGIYIFDSTNLWYMNQL